MGRGNEMRPGTNSVPVGVGLLEKSLPETKLFLERTFNVRISSNYLFELVCPLRKNITALMLLRFPGGRTWDIDVKRTSSAANSIGSGILQQFGNTSHALHSAQYDHLPALSLKNYYALAPDWAAVSVRLSRASTLTRERKGRLESPHLAG